MNRSVVAAGVVSLVLAGMGARVASAQHELRPPTKKVFEPDKVKVERFDASPNPVPDASPGTWLTMVVRNLSAVDTVSVPWKIYVGDSWWMAGVTDPIPPGGTFTRTVGSAITPGGITFELRLDPNKTLGEFGIPAFADNVGRVTVGREVPATRRLRLRLEPARSAGAGFPVNPERNRLGDVPCDCSARRWFDGDDDSMTLHNEPPSAYFRLVCTGLTGGKADPEAFKDFRLKNGYRIVGVFWDQTNDNDVAAGFTKEVVPAIGSDNPYTKIHVWGERGADFEVWLQIVVEGPADKDPFH